MTSKFVKIAESCVNKMPYVLVDLEAQASCKSLECVDTNSCTQSLK